MENTDPGPLRQLATEMAWMRRLARALLRDGDADDLAQDAWIVANEHAPSEGATRPWLGRVMQNLVRMRARSRKRREAREEKTADLVQPDVRPDDLVERVELQQLVAGEVLALAEPYRSTVLLHYFEELSCAEIARRQDIPEGTVRRRLKVALDHLRARLGARRRGGLLALAPLAGLTHSPQVPAALGVIAMKKLVAAIVVLILLVIAGVMWRSRDTSAPPARSATSDRHANASGASTGSARGAEARDAIPAWLAQAGAPAHRIAGRVTFRGAPMAGASVELASVASESGLVEAPRTTTNAAGAFDFGPQRAMRWSVRASAPGKASAGRDIDLRDPRADAEHVELALGECTAAMTGIVRDASGGPIANARIAPILLGTTNEIPGGAGVKTDEKGAYELCVETRWPGWVRVEVSADSYASISYATVVPGRIEVNFALVPEATIVGRVVRDDNGAPVPQALVFVPIGAGMETTPLRTTFTDASGRFRLDRMMAGRHLVFARGEDLAPSVEGTPVVVGVGQTSVEIEIRLEAGSTLRGRVVDGDKPIVGANVVVLDGARSGPSAFSQEDGTFVLAGVARGEMRFSALPYEVVSPKSFRVVQAVHENVTLEVEPLGTIIGHVIRAKQPVPGATIHIQGPNDRDLEPIAADAHGRFEARGLQPGPWTLFASDDHVGAFGKAPEVIQLGRAQTAEVTIDLAYAGAIEGRVVDQDGNPVAGVTVFFRSTTSDDAGTAATAADGTFRAATLTGGARYRPVVRRNLLARTGLRPVAGGEFPLVEVADGAAEVKGIVLAVQLDHLTISGKVVDTDGAPVPDARVLAQFVDEGAPARVDYVGYQDPADTTTVDGQFAFDDLLAGAYTLRARSADGVEATATGIRAGRSDVTIVLPAAGGIDVTVVGFKTAPQVSAIRSGASGQNAPITATAGANGFTLRRLSPGSYFVTARTSTEAASTQVTVVSGRTIRATLTSAGSTVVAGRVRDFKTNAPVQGMTCRAQPRAGTEVISISLGEGARTDAQGAFSIAAAPAGPLAIVCDGLWRTYSDGVRLVTAQPAQRLDVDVPVVRWSDDVIAVRSDLGAELDPTALVPRFVNVRANGPAAVARFADGDVIVSVDGTSVTELSPDGVFGLLIYRAPGTKVRVGATRGGTAVTGEITLGDAR